MKRYLLSLVRFHDSIQLHYLVDQLRKVQKGFLAIVKPS